MIIRNGLVFDENGRFVEKDLYIENGKIVASVAETADKNVIDAAGLKVIPGLVDVHSHGALGHDVSEGSVEGLHTILRYEKQHGITSYCPTSVTLPIPRLQAIFSVIAQTHKANMQDEARILGIHMEGPFLDEKKRGAHESRYILPPAEDLWELCQNAANGLIRLITLAPNVTGALEFIEKFHDQVHISLGHTSTDYETAKAAFCCGADHVTHLFNGMTAIGHREPGIIPAAAEAECMVELISDGIHVHPAMVRNSFRMFGAKRMVLISDSLMATGMEDGVYQLGDQGVTLQNRKVTLTDGTIAGSAMNLFDCMKQAMAFGVPEEDAILAATYNPAKSIGLEHLVGVLAPGRYADILLVNDAYEIQKIIA